VTTECDGEVAGMIVSSLTSISADPTMVGFFAHQDASINQPMTKSGRFVANILGEDHRAVMADFLQLPQGISRFKQGNWGRNPHNIPLLQDALASLECDIVFTQTLGTHQLIAGKIRKSAHAYANPLVYFNANTHNLLVESEVEPT